MEVYIDNVPDSIINENSLLFHGTSNIAEPFIDSNSFNPESRFSQKVCEEIIEIYREMNWDGSPRGYGVLSSFSIIDYKNKNERFLFLADNVNRAALFATQDFAAGELVRSLFYSILDLKEYLEQEHLRNNHKAYIEFNYIYYRNKYDVDLKELTVRVNNLESLFINLTELRNKYQYGVVYCYKVESDQYYKLKDRGNMGIVLTQDLDKSSLIAKIILSDSKAIEINDNRSQNKLMLKKKIFWKQNLIADKLSPSFRTIS
jgi:hypothetical protein